MSAPATTIAPIGPPGAQPSPVSEPERPRGRPSPWHAVLTAVLALSAVLNFRQLSQNGYANIFYSAAVKSDLASVHNFLFVSFDPHGFISVDKPPIAIWVQVVSAKLFGFHPLSVLAPEALAGVLSVLVLYRIVAPRAGRPAAVASAAALAVFPSFVAVSRANGPDPVLILLMLCACACGLSAVRTGRWRSLLGCAVLVGLAFNTKTLAALPIVPGLGLAFLVCGPASLPRRLAQLTVAALVLVAVSGAWILYVDQTPASHRPFVGSSTDNTEFNLTFEYNGFGRVNGQSGGPGNVPKVGFGSLPPARTVTPARYGRTAGGAIGRARAALQHAALDLRQAIAAPPHRETAAERRAYREHLLRLRRHAAAAAAVAVVAPGELKIPRTGHALQPSAFGGPIGVLRLLSLSLGGQDGWYLAFALIGLVAIALTRPQRRDPALAAAIVLGSWFLAEVVLLSSSKGIVHPYYVSAIGPGAAAMTGMGAAAVTRSRRRLGWHLILIPTAAGGTVATEIVLLHREHYLLGFVPVLIVVAAAAVLVALVVRRAAGVAVAALLAVLLVAPMAYASTLWDGPTDSTFPAAGPHAALGSGGVGASPATSRADARLMNYINRHPPATQWKVMTVASDTAAPLILENFSATALAGYSGDDPALDARGLATLVATGKARFVLLGGAYSTRGGNGATRATRVACLLVPSLTWRGIAGGGSTGLQLYDCAGREAQLDATG